ncbi:hypothetical protein [Microbacterium atlanticum]|uniref:hypothetical protein n=1 Tax=Microbacterium atlanticum TaxID=2782168 RepID=UPI00188945D6|nr:hypothetical protein [Microbacterium atlanticum]
MSTQEQTAEDERRALLARAYGPHADIQDDPEAVRRLRELEEQSRLAAAGAAQDPRGAAVTGVSAAGVAAPRSATAVSAAAGGGNARDASAGDDPPAGAAAWWSGRDGGEHETDRAGAAAAARANGSDARSAEQGQPVASARRDGGSDAEAITAGDGLPPAYAPAHGQTPARASGERWTRRTRVLWIGSVVVAALVASAVTLAASSLMNGRVAVLAIDPDAEPPEDFFQPAGEAVVFEEFFGLMTVLTPQEWARGEVLDCVFVRSAAGDAPMSTGGCGGGGFSPTASTVVTPSFPRELREQFPDGTALQFVVVDGTEVHVYAKAPVVPPGP